MKIWDSQLAIESRDRATRARWEQHRWFAWKPVQVGSRDDKSQYYGWVWLETLYRQRVKTEMWYGEFEKRLVGAHWEYTRIVLGDPND